MTSNQNISMAVFTRNYEHHLTEAYKRCQAAPDSRVLFRAAKRWTAARDYIEKYGPIPIYFVPVNSDNRLIAYIAQLVEVSFDLHRFTEDQVRELSVGNTKNEGFWEEEGEPTVKTLYFVSHCRKLEPSIHFTKLRKYSDGTPIAGNYGYSYVPVQQHTSLKG